MSSFGLSGVLGAGFGRLGSGLLTRALLAITAPSGLISYWTLNATAAATDSWGSNNGTNTAITAGTTHIAGTYSFNGTTSHSAIPSSSSIAFDRTQLFSASLWVNPSTFTASEFQSLIGNLLGATNMGWEVALVSGPTTPATNTGVQVFLGNTYPTNCILVTSAPGTISASAWSHIAVTYDGSSLAAGVKIYINGSLLTNTVPNDNLSSTTVNTNPIWIGERSDSTSPYGGLMDDVRLYGRVLSQAEVSAIFTAGSAGNP